MTPNGTLSGFYRALVVSAEDPEKQGRVRVRIPDLMVDKGWGTGDWCKNGIWARPGNNWIGGRNTYDTKGNRCSLEDAWYQGSCMPPPKGSHVFVIFEKGDPSHPFYTFAADYGQTKVLPENRVGSEWWKKWTPIKTREGRCLVFSDDKDDARVEITGKKRKIYRTPDGDTESVFNIDGNQSVFLIDERPDHEKIFLKDYRGNYIKMIQNEEGVNDQLHVYFKDDIHLETLKNIYIEAHENIHITADKNIYITALDSMYIKVDKEFHEMARNIHRYAELLDLRTAGLSINDSATLSCTREASVLVNDIAGIMNTRSAMIIGDEASAIMSIQGHGTTSVTSGGATFIDGATVIVGNGSLPIPAIPGCLKASVSKKAKTPNPDPDRHFKTKDDEWEPEAEEENPQYKPHQSFWSTQYKYDKISQSDSSITEGAGSSGSSSASIEDTTHKVEESSNTTIQTKSEEQTESSNSSTSKQSISSSLSNSLDKVSKSASQIIESATEFLNNVKDTIQNSTDNSVSKIKNNDDVDDTINTITKSDFKNNIVSTLSDVTEDKNTELTDSVESSNPMDSDVSGVIEKINKEINESIYGTRSSNSLDPDVVYVKVQNVLNNNKTLLINTLSSKYNSSIEKNIDTIKTELRKKYDNYSEITKNSFDSCCDDFVSTMSSSLNSIVKDVIEMQNLDFDLELNDMDSVFKSVYSNFSEEYCNGINKDNPIFDTKVNKIIGEINTEHTSYINNTTYSTISDLYTDLYSDNKLYSKIVEILDEENGTRVLLLRSVNKTAGDKITDYFSSELENYKKIIENNINNFIKLKITNETKDIDNTLDLQISPIELSDEKYDQTIPSDIETKTKNSMIDNIVPIEHENIRYDNSNYDDGDEDLTKQINQKIIDSIPEQSDIKEHVLDDINEDFSECCFETVPDKSIISESSSIKIFTCIEDNLESICETISNSDVDITYKKLCEWDKSQDILDYILESVYDCITENICSVYSTDLSEYLQKSLKIKKDNCNVNNYINNINYCIVKNCISEIFIQQHLTDEIGDIVDDYYDDRGITDVDKVNEIINESKDKLMDFNNDIIEKLKSNLDYDPENDLTKILNNEINTTIPQELEKLKEDNGISDDAKKIISDSLKSVKNITQYSDFIKTTINNELDGVYPISDNFNPLIKTIIGDIDDTLKNYLNNKIENDLKTKKSTSLTTLCQKCKDKDPSQWDNDEIVNANVLMSDINDFYNNFKDTSKIRTYLTSIEYETIIKNTIDTKLNENLPSKESIKSLLDECIDDTCKKTSDYIKKVCSDNIVLDENLKDNEFNPDFDLTKIYRLPGNVPVEHVCDCTQEDSDALWCDPDVIGGCGCIYEYMLFLKNKFYRTIIPILYNDNIKTVGFSLNPNMDNLHNTYNLHDADIINGYTNLISDVYNDVEIVESSNKYLLRIDDLMDTIQSISTSQNYNFTCIVNLLDFGCDNYMWLEKLSPMLRYTHEMVDDKFVKLLKILIKHVYYKNGTKRNCRIILNLGNGHYINSSDLNNEKYSLYPNCGFIRELIMKLTYNQFLTTNYMSITANNEGNLYYYSPYTQFKSYDDYVERELDNYDICIRDSVDGFKNGEADTVKYGDDNTITGGYAKFYIDCKDKTYAVSYIDNLDSWCEKIDSTTQKPIIDKYKYNTDQVDSNIMNDIFTPNARKAMRYFYKGHKKYFEFTPCKFDRDTGDLEG